MWRTSSYIIKLNSVFYWWFGAGGAKKVRGGAAHYVCYGTKLTAAKCAKCNAKVYVLRSIG